MSAESDPDQPLTELCADLGWTLIKVLVGTERLGWRSPAGYVDYAHWKNMGIHGRLVMDIIAWTAGVEWVSAHKAVGGTSEERLMMFLDANREALFAFEQAERQMRAEVNP
ncbi:hypothetical protein SEA_COMPOSTIA_85 [Mycobacterium phage Compostia]|nr:hypothetical protein SEA_COMPOSTIA_85 [Mycobacterium phage Compostia]